MADWNGMALTNYFRVKDEAAFRNWAEELDLVVINDDQGGFGLYGGTDGGGFPSWRDTGDGPQDLDLTAELAGHLDDGSVAVLMEVGHEKARYIGGHALAVDSTGKHMTIALSDIYEKAAEFFHVDLKSISGATY